MEEELLFWVSSSSSMMARRRFRSFFENSDFCFRPIKLTCTYFQGMHLQVIQQQLKLDIGGDQSVVKLSLTKSLPREPSPEAILLVMALTSSKAWLAVAMVWANSMRDKVSLNVEKF